MNPKKPRTMCLNCGKEPSRAGMKYCSLVCQAEYQFKMRVKNVVKTGNVSDGFGGPRSAKRYILWRDGSICSICGCSEWRSESIPLVLDHIDGNSDNWSETNLRLVCGNCDMQLPTYKSRNKGNGRFRRRVRYANGGSY